MNAGLTRPAAAQETPVVRMGNNYFDPIELHGDPGTTVRFEVAAGAHSVTPKFSTAVLSLRSSLIGSQPTALRVCFVPLNRE